MASASVECPACRQPIRCQPAVGLAVVTECGCEGSSPAWEQLGPALFPALRAHVTAAALFRAEVRRAQ